MSADSTPSGPFLRVFVNDWLDPASRINTLTPAQECAYFRLCLFQFRDPEGFLPDAPALLMHYARIAPADADEVLRPVLEAFFEHDKARKRWSCPRVHEEWLRSHKKIEQATLAADARWKKKRSEDATAMRPHMQMEMEKEIKKQNNGSADQGPRLKIHPLATETAGRFVEALNHVFAKDGKPRGWNIDSVGSRKAVSDALTAGYDPLLIRSLPWLAAANEWTAEKYASKSPPDPSLLLRFKGGVNPETGREAQRWLDTLPGAAGGLRLSGYRLEMARHFGTLDTLVSLGASVIEGF